jgi:membrane protein YdbS with pleckstrin-like domain
LLLVEIVLLAAIFALVRERGIALLLFALLALILAVALLARIFALVLVRLDFEKRWYLVTDRSLRVREGIFNVREMTITFANIQNVAISQGPIQRAIGIADLRVDTAGGASNSGDKKFAGENLHTVRFRGVNNADEIRALITARLAELRDSGLGDHEELSRPSADVGDSSQVLLVLREIHVEAKAVRERISRAA